MKCAVITPIGPGHVRVFDECRASVTRAIARSRGPFAEVNHFAFGDERGEKGRARARNAGAAHAVSSGADWLFFLDADDLMVEDAFARVADHIDRYDAIWGVIYELERDATDPRVRVGQDAPIRTAADVLRLDPGVSLQIGHFVRAEIALHNPFDAALDPGEEFDYYLRIWHRYRCAKLPHPLFLNRRGLRSEGPRTVSAAAWRQQVLAIMARFAEREGLSVS